MEADGQGEGAPATLFSVSGEADVPGHTGDGMKETPYQALIDGKPLLSVGLRPLPGAW